MNQNSRENWVQTKPYTAMLRSYQTTAERLRLHQSALMLELRTSAERKQGTLMSAKKQKELEERIALLRTEYYELAEVMRALRVYAEREVQ
ncbi:MAG: hypothetical protein MJ065_05225 [Oscillospiraceae bacterium]|nr:hypothetical protein [Oscillospiraceae bacterium]